jgi:surface antigen
VRLSVRPLALVAALAVAPATAAMVHASSATAAHPARHAAAAAAGGNALSAAVSAGLAAEVVSRPRPVVLSRSKAAATSVARPAHPAARPAAVRPAAQPVVKPVVKVAAPKPVPKPAPSTAATHTAAPAAPAPAAGGDDYPYRTSTGGSDRWGFTTRQCVSFAAWRLAQHGHALDNATQHWDSALHWDEAAAQQGVTVTRTPRVGAIAQWNAGESSSVAGGGRFTAGSYGHVGYVAAVYSDGTVLVEQYNLGGDRTYSALRMTAPRYLVF